MEKSENGGFTLKTHRMFSIHITPKEIKTRNNQRFLDFFRFVFERIVENLLSFQISVDNRAIGLTVKIKLSFQISPAYCGQFLYRLLLND